MKLPKKFLISTLTILSFIPITSFAYDLGNNTTQTNINIRSSAKVGNNLRGNIKKGGTVEVKKILKNWCEINYKNKPAYIYCPLLKAKENPSTIPPTTTILEPADQTNYALFSSASAGFSIEYPKNWAVVHENNNDYVSFNLNNKNPLLSPYAGFQFYNVANGNGFGSEGADLVDWKMKNITGTNGVVFKVHFYKSKSDPNGISGEIYDIYPKKSVFAENYLPVINFGYDSSKVQNGEQIIDYMIKSLKKI